MHKKITTIAITTNSMPLSMCFIVLFINLHLYFAFFEYFKVRVVELPLE